MTYEYQYSIPRFFRMMKIYNRRTFDVHKLIREQFDVFSLKEKKIGPTAVGYQDRFSFIVRSEIVPLHPQLADRQTQIDTSWVESGQSFPLEVHISFCNRNKAEVVSRDSQSPSKYGFSKLLDFTSEDDRRFALEKFCSLSGVQLASGHAEISPLYHPKRSRSEDHTLRSKENCIFNTCRLRGRFEIIDEEKFKQAYLQGVGSRRSYGYGMIRIIDQVSSLDKEVLDEEFADLL